MRTCHRYHRWYRYHHYHCYYHHVHSYRTHCYHHTSIAWIRSNGIRLRYCHFQEWKNQVVESDHGSWHHYYRRNCPHNMYVNGFRVKSSARDGMGGLILYCKHMYEHTKHASVRVYDRTGTWHNSIIEDKQFIYAGKVRKLHGYITALSFTFTAPPVITGFSIKYEFPSHVAPEQYMLDRTRVTNHASSAMTQEVEFRKRESFNRLWHNNQGELQHLSFAGERSSEEIKAGSVPVPILSSKIVHEKTVYSLAVGDQGVPVK